ncbi:hypothetical protein QE374_003110 [Microbacterium sp. SORGH_AS428]|nr:hypothetical protein [Microbacterium sp. SORGH_AS_0428]
MLRLDPAYPPVWRDERTLQFGDQARAVIAEAEPWHEWLVHALRTGVSANDAMTLAASLGADRAAVADMLEQLAPVLCSDAPRTRVGFEVSDAVDGAVAVAVIRLLDTSVELVTDPDERCTVIMLESFVADPGRYRGHLRDERPHLPVILAGDRVHVGPLVTPGDGPCLACDAAHRRDEDAAWPGIAAQLMSQPAPPVTAALLGEAVAYAARLLTGQLPPSAARCRMTFAASSPHRRSAWPVVHPACACRSLAEISTAAAPDAPTAMPTRATAYARPA